MSEKRRIRSKTIAFRMSEAEKIDLENKVEAVGNPLMFLQFKRVLERIELMVKDGEGIDEELKNCLFEMLKILESFEKNNKVL